MMKSLVGAAMLAIKLRRFCLVFAIALALLSPSSVFALTFDLADDFSGTSNPNGVWSYGYRGYSEAIGSFTAYTYYSTGFHGTQLVRWHTGSSEPHVAYNPTDHAITVSNTTWGPGQVSLHPGYSGQYSIARFTSPETGYYDLEGAFSAGSLTPTGVDVYVLIGSAIGFSNSVTKYGSPTLFSLDHILLGVGNTVDFVVGYRGDYGCDTTIVEARISTSPVPEPATMFLLGSGLVGLAGLRRKFKK